MEAGTDRVQLLSEERASVRSEKEGPTTERPVCGGMEWLDSDGQRHPRLHTLPSGTQESGTRGPRSNLVKGDLHKKGWGPATGKAPCTSPAGGCQAGGKVPWLSVLPQTPDPSTEATRVKVWVVAGVVSGEGEAP